MDKSNVCSIDNVRAIEITKMKTENKSPSPSVTVRDATRMDLNIIREMHNLLCHNEFDNGFDLDIDVQWSYSDQFSEYILSRISNENGITLIAEISGHVVAYLVGSQSDKKGVPTCHLESIFVLPSHRRRGAGIALITRFLNWAKQKRLKRMTVAVAPQNKSAVALYKQMGFREHTLVLDQCIPEEIANNH